MGFLINPFMVAPGGPQSPSDLANLVRWYKADSFSLSDGTAIGGTGNEWLDQSGSGADLTQATAGQRPVYHTNIFGSMPAITFTAASSQGLAMTDLTLAASPTGRFTIIVIAATTNDNIILGTDSAGTGNTQVRFRHGGPQNIAFFFAGVGVDSSPFTNAQTSIRSTCWRRSDAFGSILFRDNKISVASGGNDPGVADINQVGLSFGLFTNGNVAEICIYTASHSDADLDALYDNYFRPRWGLP
jgi:hypothetical protein